MKKELLKALAAFQQEVPVILKDTQGYGYSYADLPAIFAVINPLLKKHGLGFNQIIDGTRLVTSVFHVESGEAMEGAADIPQGVNLKGMNEFQVLGSAITYMRRYALSSMLGLVTDKDTDAAGEQVKAPEKQGITEWLSEEQFKTAMNADAKGILATLKAFNGQNGKAMKKEYREQLQSKIV